LKEREGIQKKGRRAENKLIKKTSSEELFFSLKKKRSFSKKSSFTHFVEGLFANFIANNF